MSSSHAIMHFLSACYLLRGTYWLKSYQKFSFSSTNIPENDIHDDVFWTRIINHAWLLSYMHACLEIFHAFGHIFTDCMFNWKFNWISSQVLVIFYEIWVKVAKIMPKTYDFWVPKSMTKIVMHNFFGK